MIHASLKNIITTCSTNTIMVSAKIIMQREVKKIFYSWLGNDRTFHWQVLLFGRRISDNSLK